MTERAACTPHNVPVMAQWIGEGVGFRAAEAHSWQLMERLVEVRRQRSPALAPASHLPPLLAARAGTPRSQLSLSALRARYTSLRNGKLVGPLPGDMIHKGVWRSR